MDENFPKVEKEKDIQIEEPHRVPNKMNPKRHITIRVSKVKDNKRILKAGRDKTTCYVQRNPHEDY